MSENVKEPESEAKPTPQTKEYTPEEIEALEKERSEQKAELMIYYEAELPLLRLHAEYEECLTRIEIAEMTRLKIMMDKAKMMGPPPKPGEGASTPGRKLKDD